MGIYLVFWLNMKHYQWLKSVENLHDSIFMWKFSIWKTPLEILIPSFTLRVSTRMIQHCNDQLKLTLKLEIYLPPNMTGCKSLFPSLPLYSFTLTGPCADFNHLIHQTPIKSKINSWCQSLLSFKTRSN